MRYVYVTARKDSKSRYKKYKLYHISPIDQPSVTKLILRVPSNNWLVENGYEDGTTKRISFAPSIGKCLSAVSSNIKGKRFRVYALDYFPTGFKPTAVQVSDAKVTQEYWVTVPIKNPDYLGIIEIIGCKPLNMEDIALAVDDDDFTSNATEQQFIQKFYPKNPAKGRKMYNLYQDKPVHMSYEAGNRTYYLADWKWRWIKREDR